MSHTFSYAVVIGRFQPFHNGHLSLVGHALDIANRVVIVVGSSFAARNVKNPFTFEERKRMILDSLLEAGLDDHRVKVVGVQDYHYNENMWVTDLATKVQQATNWSHDVVLVGHRKDASTYYLDLFPYWQYVEHDPARACIWYGGPAQVLNATDVRRLLYRGDDRWRSYVPTGTAGFLAEFVNTEEFAELVADYNYLNEYPKIWGEGPFITVDAVVFHKGHVLLVERGERPGKGLFALPGGFLDKSERLLDGALRELREETGLAISPKTLVDKEVFDAPQRSLRGRVITHAFNFVLDGEEEKLEQVKGGDDAAKALWMPIYDVLSSRERFYEDHHDIISYFALRR